MPVASPPPPSPPPPILPTPDPSGTTNPDTGATDPQALQEQQAIAAAQAVPPTNLTLDSTAMSTTGNRPKAEVEAALYTYVPVVKAQLRINADPNMLPFNASAQKAFVTLYIDMLNQSSLRLRVNKFTYTAYQHPVTLAQVQPPPPPALAPWRSPSPVPAPTPAPTGRRRSLRDHMDAVLGYFRPSRGGDDAAADATAGDGGDGATADGMGAPWPPQPTLAPSPELVPIRPYESDSQWNSDYDSASLPWGGPGSGASGTMTEDEKRAAETEEAAWWASQLCAGCARTGCERGMGSAGFAHDPVPAETPAYLESFDPWAHYFGMAGRRGRGLQQYSPTFSRAVQLPSGKWVQPRVNFTLEVYLEYTDLYTTYAFLASPSFQQRLMDGGGMAIHRMELLSAEAQTLTLYTGRLKYVDTTPPVLTLVGADSVRVAQFDAYTDLGATARDNLDMDIPRWKIIVRNVPVDTSATTPAGQPWMIYYDVWDYYGLPAATLSRAVEIYDPCVILDPITGANVGEVMCPALKMCSVGLSCEQNTLTFLSASTAAYAGLLTLPASSLVTGSLRILDSEPPTITLLPLTAPRFLAPATNLSGVITRVPVGTAFVEPGWIARDNLDTQVQSNVVRFGVDAVSTLHPTPETAPFMISYNAMDFSGNIARSQWRLVYVDCPAGLTVSGPDDSNNYYCASMQGVPDMDIKGSATTGTSTPQTQGFKLLTNTPPVITLAGPAEVHITQGQAYTVCPRGGDSLIACDLGASASDAEDGDLTFRLRACAGQDPSVQSLWLLTGVTACNITKYTPPGIYTIDYSVEDAAGAVATTKRTLYVEALCPNSQAPCSDMQCPEPDGTCNRASILASVSLSAQVIGDASSVNTPPRLTLLTDASLGTKIHLPQGATYQRCAKGVSPAPNTLCELGAVAVDDQDADMTYRVYACPPQTCIDRCEGCAGHEWAVKGITGCVDTSQKVGTTIVLPFVACDSWKPAMSAYVERTIQLASKCTNPGKPHLCNGQCSATACEVLTAIGATPTVPTPPTLLLMDPGATVLADGRAANRTLYTVYQQVAPLSFLPCPSTSKVKSCAAVAFDDVDGDLSAKITVSDVTACASGTTCIKCIPTLATTGACPPGRYTLQYSVKNSQGVSANLTYSLVVEVWAVTSLDFTYFSQQTDPTALQNEAISLIVNSTLGYQTVTKYLPFFGVDTTQLRQLTINGTRVVGPSEIEVNVTFALGSIPNYTIPQLNLGRRRALLASDTSLVLTATGFGHPASLAAAQPEADTAADLWWGLHPTLWQDGLETGAETGDVDPGSAARALKAATTTLEHANELLERHYAHKDGWQWHELLHPWILSASKLQAAPKPAASPAALSDSVGACPADDPDCEDDPVALSAAHLDRMCTFDPAMADSSLCLCSEDDAETMPAAGSGTSVNSTETEEWNRLHLLVKGMDETGAIHSSTSMSRSLLSTSSLLNSQASRRLAVWLTRNVLPEVQAVHDKLAAALDPVISGTAVLTGPDGGLGGSSRRRRLQSSSCSTLNVTGLTLTADAASLGLASLPTGATTACIASTPTNDQLLLSVLSSTLAEIDRLDQLASGAAVGSSALISGVNEVFDAHDDVVDATIESFTDTVGSAYLSMLQKSYMAFDRVVGHSPLEQAQQHALQAGLQLLAGAVAASYAAANQQAVQTALVLQGLGLNEMDPSTYSDYLACLLQRSQQFSVAFRIYNYGPDPLAVSYSRRRRQLQAYIATNYPENGPALPPEPAMAPVLPPEPASAPPPRTNRWMRDAVSVSVSRFWQGLASSAGGRRRAMEENGNGNGLHGNGNGDHLLEHYMDSRDLHAAAGQDDVLHELLKPASMQRRKLAFSTAPSTSGNTSLSSNTSAAALPPSSVWMDGYLLPRAWASLDEWVASEALAASHPNLTRIVGARANMLMGGLLLHQVRLPVATVSTSSCTSTYSNLEQLCVYGDSQAVKVHMEDQGGMGMDPVCQPKTALYDPTIAAYPGQWYDMRDVNQSVDGLGNPYAFQFMGGDVMGDVYTPGYPVFVSSHLPNSRVRTLLTYLLNGTYLSRQLTDSVSAEVLTFNPDLYVFGYWRGTFKWARDGFITLRHTFQGLPAIDYTQYILHKQYWQFIPDWIMVVFMAGYLLGALVDTVRSMAAQKRIADVDATPAVHLTPAEMYARQQRAKRTYKERTSGFWMAYEAAIVLLMLAALCCLYFYVFVLSPQAPVQTNFDVYDADAYAPAHMLMLRKDEAQYHPGALRDAVASAAYVPQDGSAASSETAAAAAAAAAKLVSGTMPQPGEPFRWILPDDPQQLQAVAHMYSSYRHMYDVWVWYGLLQAIVLLLLMLRLINKTGFQPRLAVVAGTLAHFLADFLHFVGVLFVAMIMLAAICHLMFGYRVEMLADAGIAISSLLQYMFTGVNTVSADSFSLAVILPTDTQLSAPETAMAEIMLLIFPLLFISVLFMYIPAMMLVPLRLLRRANTKTPGVMADLLSRARWAVQQHWGKQPSNRRLDKQLDWLLLPPLPHSWWFHQVYAAVVKTTTAAQFDGRRNKRRAVGRAMRVLQVDFPELMAVQLNYKKLAQQFDGLFLDKPYMESRAYRLLVEDVDALAAGRPKWSVGNAVRALYASLSGQSPTDDRRDKRTPLRKLLDALPFRTASMRVVPEADGRASGRLPPLALRHQDSGASSRSGTTVSGSFGEDSFSSRRGGARRSAKVAPQEPLPPVPEGADMAGMVSRLLINRFGINVVRPPPSTLEQLLIDARRRLQSGGSADGTRSSGASGSSFLLPSGARLRDLRRQYLPSGSASSPTKRQAGSAALLPVTHTTTTADARGSLTAVEPFSAPQDLLSPGAQQILSMAKGGQARDDVEIALQLAIQTALRNMGDAMHNIMGPAVPAEDPDLMAAMFAAQFASQVPLPAAGAPRRPQRRLGAVATTAAVAPPGLVPMQDEIEPMETEGEQLAQALWAAAHGAHGAGAALPGRPQRRRQLGAAAVGSQQGGGAFGQPPAPAAAASEEDVAALGIAMMHAGFLPPEHMAALSGLAETGPSAADAASEPAVGPAAPTALLTADVPLSPSRVATPQAGDARSARSPAAMVQVLTSHALRLQRELATVQDGLQGSITHTNALIAAVLQRRLLPRITKASTAIPLPGTPSGAAAAVAAGAAAGAGAAAAAAGRDKSWEAEWEEEGWVAVGSGPRSASRLVSEAEAEQLSGRTGSSSSLQPRRPSRPLSPLQPSTSGPAAGLSSLAAAGAAPAASPAAAAAASPVASRPGSAPVPPGPPIPTAAVPAVAEEDSLETMDMVSEAPAAVVPVVTARPGSVQSSVLTDEPLPAAAAAVDEDNATPIMAMTTADFEAADAAAAAAAVAAAAERAATPRSQRGTPRQLPPVLPHAVPSTSGAVVDEDEQLLLDEPPAALAAENTEALLNSLAPPAPSPRANTPLAAVPPTEAERAASRGYTLPDGSSRSSVRLPPVQVVATRDVSSSGSSEVLEVEPAATAPAEASAAAEAAAPLPEASVTASEFAALAPPRAQASEEEEGSAGDEEELAMLAPPPMQATPPRAAAAATAAAAARPAVTPPDAISTRQQREEQRARAAAMLAGALGGGRAARASSGSEREDTDGGGTISHLAASRSSDAAAASRLVLAATGEQEDEESEVISPSSLAASAPAARQGGRGGRGGRAGGQAGGRAGPAPRPIPPKPSLTSRGRPTTATEAQAAATVPGLVATPSATGAVEAGATSAADYLRRFGGGPAQAASAAPALRTAFTEAPPVQIGGGDAAAVAPAAPDAAGAAGAPRRGGFGRSFLMAQQQQQQEEEDKAGGT